MAKAKANSLETKTLTNISRPKVHAKSNSSSLKSSKNYKKKYVGQGK